MSTLLPSQNTSLSISLITGKRIEQRRSTEKVKNTKLLQRGFRAGDEFRVIYVVEGRKTPVKLWYANHGSERKMQQKRMNAGCWMLETSG